MIYVVIEIRQPCAHLLVDLCDRNQEKPESSMCLWILITCKSHLTTYKERVEHLHAFEHFSKYCDQAFDIAVWTRSCKLCENADFEKRTQDLHSVHST